MRIFGVVCVCLVLAITVLAAVGDGQWLSHVPEKDAARQNPLAHQPQAAEIGAKLFRQHCAECHSDNGEGRHGKPNLHSERVSQATPGQLFWLLTNGSLKNGMPSWSRLPEQQRWQLVSYLKTFEEQKSLSSK